MAFFRSFLFVSAVVFICFGVGRAIDCELDMKNPSKVAYTIVVDLAAGLGNFTRVQDAIDSIPSRNTRWIRIYLNPGIYREQVKVPADKTCIMLEGRDQGTTSIEFDAHAATDTSPTVTFEAENFVAKGISFKNTYNIVKQNVDGSQITQAVAAAVKGDKSSFYNCGFYGVQDTLWDAIGRHYFQDCQIEGAVDFIWGDGQSIYKNCQIMVNGNALEPGGSGYITAQGRYSEEDPSGFVFSGGSVNGNRLALLGRAYGSYSRVIFDGTMFSEIVDPTGWNAWYHAGEENKITYAESDCQGPGSDTSKRVNWEKKLSPEEIHRFTHLSYIDQEGWLAKQP